MNVDFHAHIQPEADHGCLNADMALRQLRLAANAGIDAVVSVSHFYPNSDDAERYLKLRQASKDRLLRKTEGESDLPQVIFGTEVTLCHGLYKLKQLRELCIEGTDCLLIEMPRSDFNDSAMETLDIIRDEMGLRPVIAHIDRYSPRLAEALLEREYLCQINVGSFGGLFGNRQALKWIDSGFVAALGSDIHLLNVGYKYWDKARKAIGDERYGNIMSQSAGLLGL